jgi:sulfane dehydrogenase subunit SoxC
MPRNPTDTRSDRRRFLGLGAVLGGTLSACKTTKTTEPTEPSSLGKPLRAYGERSPFEKTARLIPDVKNPEIGSTRTPLQDSYGILTPSSLHFERHHSGVPRIDPTAHRLLLHGMVERPLMLTMDDIRRLPAVSRIHFIECAGNSGSEWGPKTAPDAQRAHGLASCSEWTGVPLSILLAEAGVRPGASWIVAEGADACHMQRSIPLKKANDDVLVASDRTAKRSAPSKDIPCGW